MLPDDEHLELLSAWAAMRPQPRCEAGIFPGWGDGYYQKLNTDYYWLMGRFLQGPYDLDYRSLLDRHLVETDGACNLHIAYVAAFASRFNGDVPAYMDLLRSHIEDESLGGDQQMTWLLARAFTREVSRGRPRPMTAMPNLESAFLIADSKTHQFWALQEMVSRLISVGNADRAKALLSKHRDRFSSADQIAAIEDWLATADWLEINYRDRQKANTEAIEQNYLAELQRRQLIAIDAGRNDTASRYDSLIKALPVEE